jgi:hypothetical protein
MLHAVDAFAQVEAPKPAERGKSITEAAESGTTRELLVAMRLRIAKAVENEETPARDLAALTKRLTEVVRDIEAIDAREAEKPDADGPVDDTFDPETV